MSKSIELYEEAKRIIPGGTQLLSKRPEMYLPGKWPAYYSKAKGCEVWDLDGKHYYDVCIMGVGACVLGYANEQVNRSVNEVVSCGNMCTLNAPEEVELARKMIELHPWAGMVRYSKTGGEAMSIAVRIARAYTHKDIVLVCGYHGWHDWYLAANLNDGDPLADVHLKGLEPLGVPIGLSNTNFIFHYNNMDELKALIKKYKGKIAAVVMEPIRNDYPVDDFLKKVRDITKDENIVLIFDEITAGFRICLGGSHLVLGVNPDIAVFAKAMTNGYPLSMIIGKDEIMNVAQESFISSTYWTERIGFVAALKTIECYSKYDVISYISRVGEKIQRNWVQIAEENNVRIKVSGILPLSHFEFMYENASAYKTFFIQEMLKQGFLASTSFYATYAHSNNVIEKYFESFECVMKKIKEINEKGEKIEKYIDQICHEGFERLL